MNVIKYNKEKWTQAKCNFVDTVQIFITNKCNKRCKGCFNEDRLGYQHMSPLDYLNIITAYGPHVKKVILMGGEPTLHPYMMEFIRVNQNRGLRTTIYTNGTNMEVFDNIDLTDVTIRIGVMGLWASEKQLLGIVSDAPVEIAYMLRKDNVVELKETIQYAEDHFNCKKIMISSVRNISDSGDYWKEGDGDLSHEEYFEIAQDFVDTYTGGLDEIQISVRGDMEVEGGESDQCRFMNIFPNGDKIICPFDICKNLTEDSSMIFPDRRCDKNHKCLLQKVILRRKR